MTTCGGSPGSDGTDGVAMEEEGSASQLVASVAAKSREAAAVLPSAACTTYRGPRGSGGEQEAPTALLRQHAWPWTWVGRPLWQHAGFGAW
jgi:hypothetical protein